MLAFCRASRVQWSYSSSWQPCEVHSDWKHSSHRTWWRAEPELKPCQTLRHRLHCRPECRKGSSQSTWAPVTRPSLTGPQRAVGLCQAKEVSVGPCLKKKKSYVDWNSVERLGWGRTSTWKLKRVREGRFHWNVDWISILDSHHFVCDTEQGRKAEVWDHKHFFPPTDGSRGHQWRGWGTYTAELRADQGLPRSPLLGWQLIKAWSLVFNKRDFSMEGKLWC